MATFRLLEEEVFEITKELNPGIKDQAQYKACDCYFEEIAETKPPLFSFQTKSNPGRQFPIKPRNTKVAIEDGKLTIVTYGGNSFKHCTERNLTRIFALDQGFIAQGAPKTCADNEEGQYVMQYCSLNGHPLNPVQPIKLHLFDHDDFIDLFNEHTPFKIIKVSNDYPFVLVYNWFNKYSSLCILTEEAKQSDNNRQFELDFDFSPNLILDEVFRLEENQQPSDFFLLPALRCQQLDPFCWLGVYFKEAKNLKFIKVKLTHQFPSSSFQVDKQVFGVKSLILLDATTRSQSFHESVAGLSIKRVELGSNEAARCLGERVKSIKTAELLILTQLDTLELFSGGEVVITLSNVSKYFNRKNSNFKKDTSSAQELFNQQNSKFTIRFSDQKVSRINFDLSLNWPLSAPILQCFQISLPQDAYLAIYKSFLLLKFQGDCEEREILIKLILTACGCASNHDPKQPKKAPLASNDQSWQMMINPTDSSLQINDKSGFLISNGFDLKSLHCLLSTKQQYFFELLSLLYEDLKLNTYYLEIQKQLALILFKLSSAFGISKLNHLERFASDVPHQMASVSQKWENNISEPNIAPSIALWTEKRISGEVPE